MRMAYLLFATFLFACTQEDIIPPVPQSVKIGIDTEDHVYLWEDIWYTTDLDYTGNPTFYADYTFESLRAGYVTLRYAAAAGTIDLASVAISGNSCTPTPEPPTQTETDGIVEVRVRVDAIYNICLVDFGEDVNVQFDFIEN